MKSSIYNMYEKTGSGYLLLNTLTSATARIDDEMKQLIEENTDKIPEEILNMFYENGFVVEDDCDERKMLAYQFCKDKYNLLPRDLKYTAVMTYACNLACPYCFQGHEKDTETLDNKRVDIILKNMEKNVTKKDFKALYVAFYGGEPLLAYHQCVRMMRGASRICDEQGIRLKGDIITNGTLINKDVVLNLLEPYCDDVQITMDGGREIHNKRKHFRDGGGTYDVILDALELLKDTHVRLSMRLNIDKENIDTFAELHRDLHDRGLDAIRKYLGWIYAYDIEGVPKDFAAYDEKCFSCDEIIALEDKISEQLGVMKASDKIILPMTFFHEPCAFEREDSYVVDPYLDLYRCRDLLGLDNMVIGRIDENADAVFNYRYYEQMSRDPFTFEECRACKYLPFCAGGCAYRAYLENGTFHSPPCIHEKYSVKKLISRGMDRLMKKMALSYGDGGPGSPG
jgi:uncharacterized protein